MPVEWTPAQRRQKDLDDGWTKKHAKSHHGNKLSVNVDVQNKFIRKIEMGTASEHDSLHFDAVLDKVNTSTDVYADRGYPSTERAAKLKARGAATRFNARVHATAP